MSPLLAQRRAGFTLVELLVVIAIIGVLVALLLPAVQSAREAARRMQCANNVRQIAIAVHNHHDQHNYAPPGALSGRAALSTAHRRLNLANDLYHGWGSFLLPFVEQKNLYDQYNYQRDWRHAVNQPVRDAVLPAFICPASPVRKRTDRHTSTSADSYTSFFTFTATAGDYGVMSNIDTDATSICALGLVDGASCRISGGMLQTNQLQRFAECTDGLSNTILFVEDAGRPARYQLRRLLSGGRREGASLLDSANIMTLDGYRPDGSASTGPCAINCSNNNEIYSFHPTGAHVAMSDSSIRFLAQNTAIRVVARMVTKAAGEPTGE